MTKYIFNLKTRELTFYAVPDKAKWICSKTTCRLTYNEAKILFVLANNEANTFEELEKIVYNNNVLTNKARLATAVNRLKNKYYFDIYPVWGHGYKLDSEVYIDY